MVTLTAGVTWLGAGPVAADHCRATHAQAGSPKAALCDELAKVRLSDSTGPVLGSESTHLALSAVRLAERLGLTGLATARSAVGLSDLGGFMATSAMPSLLPATPAVSGVTNLVKLPALPALPQVADLPVATRADRLQDPARIVPRPGGDIPLDLTRPVNEIKDQIVHRTLPQMSETLSETRLPINSLDGVTGLLHSLNLR